MRTNKYYKLWNVALTMVLGILMVACSEDGGQDIKGSHELHLMLGSQTLNDVTRALPEYYMTYSEYNNVYLPVNARIQGFLTTSGSSTEPPIISHFSFSDDTSNPPVRSWSSHIKIDDPTLTYYLYGFMPSEAASSVNIAPYNSDYVNGAVLTINGINAITPNDVCVIVGVKEYTRPNDQTSLPSIKADELDMAHRLGKFDIFDNNNPPVEKNYAYLLVDHIFCSLNFSIKIDQQYSQLRTIRVKQMKLTASTDETPLVKTVNATITIRPTTDNTSPLDLSGSIVITAGQTGGTISDPAMLYDYTTNNNTYLTLTTTAQDLRGYLAPAVINSNTQDPTLKFVLETTYDVYDRYENKIRENEIAKNTFSPKLALNPGENYTFNIIVTPTYLYMLSEPDLDSPTFTIN